MTLWTLRSYTHIYLLRISLVKAQYCKQSERHELLYHSPARGVGGVTLRDKHER